VPPSAPKVPNFESKAPNPDRKKYKRKKNYARKMTTRQTILRENLRKETPEKTR
jgi:hypothetical protein